MAQTLTYDPANDSVEVNDQGLNTDEQDSLKVGEELIEAEGQLLAGKYKNAEDLEKAYVELSKKLGEKSTEDSETTRDSDESDDTKETSEEEEETSEDSPALSLINEASAEYYENNGELKPETLEKFNSMSSQDLVSAYLQAQKNNPQTQAAETPDLTEGDINTVRNAVGGQGEYDKIVGWAGQNLSQNEIQAFDDLVSTGNVGAIKLAVTGLKAQYENANGFEGDMVSGKPAKRSSDVFRSQAELVAAMSDPRYDNDPAYRMDLIEKLDRSDVEF
tara:strand:- start:278 stop:1105 length:828 start_codon:yes stop_codon:yes gene_type:complete